MPAKKRSRSTAAARTRRKSTSARKKASGSAQSRARRTAKTAKRSARKTTQRAAAKAKKTTRSTSRKKTTRSKAGTTRASTAAKAKTAKKTRQAKKTVRKTGQTTTVRTARSGAGKSKRTAAAGKLTRKDLEQFRTMLLLKRAQILGDVNTLRDIARQRGSAGNLSHMPIHMADIGSDNFEQEFTLGLIQSERALLGEINEALQRIEDGTYGICAATGKPIGKARLKAKPWAKYCYEYELQLERGQHRRL